MQVKSIIIELKNNGSPSVEYIESELKKLNIIPLRWSIVYVDDKIYKVSVAQKHIKRNRLLSGPFLKFRKYRCNLPDGVISYMRQI